MTKIAVFEKLNNGENQNIFDRFRKLLGKGYDCYYYRKDCEKPDLIVVFGGDGTILAAAPYAVSLNVPILAINTGTVGFLSGYELGDIEKCVADIKNKTFCVSGRSVLSVKINDKEYIALNDAVIERDRSIEGMTIVSKLSVYINEQVVYKLSADGVIVSTPTGSTAYSLSAGGVVLTPDLSSFIVTPICSHSLGTRPIVFNDSASLKVIVGENSCDCVLSVDGKPVEKMPKGKSVTISKNVKTLKIADNNSNFYLRLYNKLQGVL